MGGQSIKPIGTVKTSSNPMCFHPYGSFESAPAKMLMGCCERNMGCPVCGYGWGCAPCPCRGKSEGGSQTYNPLVADADAVVARFIY